MSHIKDRLKQYKDKYSDCYKYAGLYVKVIQDMIEQLLNDLEQDEKENGWISAGERLPEASGTYQVTCMDGRAVCPNSRLLAAARVDSQKKSWA